MGFAHYYLAYDTAAWGANNTYAYFQVISAPLAARSQPSLSAQAAARIELVRARGGSLALPPRALRAQPLPAAARIGQRTRGYRLRPGMRRRARV